MVLRVQTGLLSNREGVGVQRTTRDEPIRRLVLAALLAGPIVLVALKPAAAADPVEIDSVAALASARGIDVSQARWELAIEDKAGLAQPLFADELGGRFAGVFVTRPPDTEVVFRSTDPSDISVAAKIAASVGLGQDWSFETAKYSLDRLQVDALAISHELVGRADVWWDTISNSVEVRVLRLQDLQVSLPETARVSTVPVLAGPTADIGGGKGISGCTSGFSVIRGTTPGIVTAGHCSNTQAYQGFNLPFQQEQNSGSTDAQWNSTPGINTLPRVYTPGGWFAITTWQSHWAQVAGSSFLKMGNVTGFADGHIDNTGFCATWVPNYQCTYIMGSHDGLDLTSPGDSGGSIWKSYSAWGVISGETFNIHTFCVCNVVWTPVDYIWQPLNIALKGT